MKKDFAKDLLVKMSKVFPTDVYFVNNRYALPGPISFESNAGIYVCVFNPDMTEALRKLFPENPVLFSSSIKKTGLVDVMEVIEEPEIIKAVQRNIDDILGQFDNATGWENFDLNEEQLTDLYDNYKTISLFKEEKDKPEIVIGKSLFPLITKKTMNDVIYTFKEFSKKDSLHSLLLNYDGEYFSLKMMYLILHV